jgi:hypothetical protein
MVIWLKLINKIEKFFIFFQTYPVHLIPVVIRGVPSSHVLITFIGDLLTNPSLRRRIFGVNLMAELVEQVCGKFLNIFPRKIFYFHSLFFPVQNPNRVRRPDSGRRLAQHGARASSERRASHPGFAHRARPQPTSPGVAIPRRQSRRVHAQDPKVFIFFNRWLGLYRIYRSECL